MPSATQPTIPSPTPSTLLHPLLTSIPTASLPQPPPQLLPHLTPILRQRVKLLAAPTIPWLPLLSYAPAAAAPLCALAHSEPFEPHPVSGEVELDVDWTDAEQVALRFRRVDAETLWARVELHAVGLWARCLHCVGDAEGPEDGWRIGEVGVLGQEDDDAQEAWHKDVESAEREFAGDASGGGALREDKPHPQLQLPQQDEQDDDDDAYWAQYDATPAATPGPPPSAPPAAASAPAPRHATEEDAYFAQYAAVQPALDAHDPDEARAHGDVESSLAGGELANGNGNGNGAGYRRTTVTAAAETDARIAQPRAHSSSSASSASGRSVAVANLEEEAERMGGEGGGRDVRNETAIRQHVASSVKSLYRLARAAGMEREAFRGLVERELAMVGMEEDEEGA